MSMKAEISSLQSVYADHIQRNIWQYWQKFDDPIHGGILNCIDNLGGALVSDQKFTWSQGRYLWLLAEMLECKLKGLLPDLDKDNLTDNLVRCRDFLLKHAFHAPGRCNYLLTREGNPVPEARTGRMAASIFSDCFVFIGLANAQRVLPAETLEDTLSTLYSTIIESVRGGNILTEPYPIPKGYRSHSIPMILINVSCEYLKLLQNEPSTQQEQEYTKQALEECLHQIFTYHVDENLGLVREFVSTKNRFETHLQDRHINPGHTLEDIWFVLEAHKLLGRPREKMSTLCTLAKRAFSQGWDPVHGGLLRFVDRDGGPPRGEKTGEAFEQLILDTWHMKIWWPHAEMLYTFLNLYFLTGDEELLTVYRKAEQYIFDVFPDKEHGEWIQIRNRKGVPEEKLVALPVKDPFHILRAYLRIVELS